MGALGALSPGDDEAAATTARSEKIACHDPQKVSFVLAARWCRIALLRSEINLKTAKRLGLTIPQSVWRRMRQPQQRR